MRKVRCVVIMTLVAAILLPMTGAAAGLHPRVHVSVTDVYRTFNDRGVATLNGKAWFENSGGVKRELLCTFQGSSGRIFNFARATIHVKVPAHSTAMVNLKLKPRLRYAAESSNDFTIWKVWCK